MLRIQKLPLLGFQMLRCKQCDVWTSHCEVLTLWRTWELSGPCLPRLQLQWEKQTVNIQEDSPWEDCRSSKFMPVWDSTLGGDGLELGKVKFLIGWLLSLEIP